MLMFLAGWGNPAYAAGGISPCGTINATVVSGQQVQINFPCSAAGWGGVIAGPTSGSIIAADPSQGSPSTYLIYANTPSAQTTDTFTIKDDSNDVITIIVTITPASTPLVVSPTASAYPTVGQSFT